MTDFVNIPQETSGVKIATETLNDGREVQVNLLGTVSGGAFAAISENNPFPVGIFDNAGNQIIDFGGGGGGGGDASAANQVAGNTTLASILAKLIAAPATEAKQDTANTTLTSILNKIIAAPATAANQDTANTTLASILSKIIAAPATEAKQDSTITSLTSILNKLIAAPATEAKQDSAITQLTNLNTKLAGTISVSSASTTSGLTPYRNINVGTTGANVKASAGTVYGGIVSNTANAWRYLKLYDKATAPTVGTDTPLLTIALPPNSSGPIPINNGCKFTLGIGVGATVLIADNDTTTPTANDVVVNLFYV